MNNKHLMGLLALGLVSSGAWAVPLTLTPVAGDLLGEAVVDGASDGYAEFGPPLPLTGSAAAVAADLAFSDAFLEEDALTLVTQAASLSGLEASATGTISYEAQFTAATSLQRLTLDFGLDQEELLGGLAETSLSFSIFGPTGSLLVDETLLFTGTTIEDLALNYDFAITPGEIGTLSILLDSSVLADVADASVLSVSSLEVAVAAVPLPSTLLVMLGGLGVLGSIRRRS